MIRPHDGIQLAGRLKLATNAIFTLGACGIGLALLLLGLRGEAFLFGPPLTEDGYCALTVARNLAHGHGMTIDGTTLSNGFQPLFTMIEAVAFYFGASDALAIRLVYVFAWAFHVAGAVLCALVARDLWPTLGGAAALAIFIPHIGAMASLHPYQYAFYNALVGGTGGAQDRFELEYWGTAYREAALKLDALVAAEGGTAPATVFVCSEGSAAAYFFSPRLKLTGDDLGADFYLATTRLDCDKEYDGDTAINVARDGAIFAVVKDPRRLRAENPARLAHRDVAGALVAPRHPGLQRDGARDPSLN